MNTDGMTRKWPEPYATTPGLEKAEDERNRMPQGQCMKPSGPTSRRAGSPVGGFSVARPGAWMVRTCRPRRKRRPTGGSFDQEGKAPPRSSQRNFGLADLLTGAPGQSNPGFLDKTVRKARWRCSSAINVWKSVVVWCSGLRWRDRHSMKRLLLRRRNIPMTQIPLEPRMRQRSSLWDTSNR